MDTMCRDAGRSMRSRRSLTTGRGLVAVAVLGSALAGLGPAAQRAFGDEPTTEAADVIVEPLNSATSGAEPAIDASGAVVVEISGMSFVASRADESELLVRADEAYFRPEQRRADLSGVHATVTREDKGERFEMRCERGTLDLETNHFRATGNVRGRTDDGREFETDWVSYDHIAGVLSTRAPVVINDAGITYRGGGFDYDIAGQRFKLIGGASVVQDQ